MIEERYELRVQVVERLGEPEECRFRAEAKCVHEVDEADPLFIGTGDSRNKALFGLYLSLQRVKECIASTAEEIREEIKEAYPKAFPSDE